MESTMADQNETRSRTPLAPQDPLRTGAPTSDARDELSIFSAPGMEVVLQWWVESNARWSRQSFGEIGYSLRQAENRL